MLFSGSEEAVSDDLSVVHYPKDYDVRGLTDEFAISEQLSLIEAPDSVRREQMRALIDKLFPHMKDDLRREIEKELKDFPAQPEPTLPPLSGGQGRAEADEEGNPAQWVAE